MIILTKEWLLKTITELEEERDATPGAVNEDAARALAAMKIALASLEAEESVPDELEETRCGGIRKCIAALRYHHKRAETCSNGYTGSTLEEDTLKSINFLKRNNIAAMLQGANDNSPVIQDGWVACSERMPGIGTEIFYFCQDDGLRDCGIVSSSNFSGKGDAELYVHAEGYDLCFGVDITHWMPLPAAPNSGD
ncbi:DUF551 domain-containing protein [Enterobacter sp. GD03975]|uniref:DUF551 domain-containing protein n=1 Tax=Enterobacter sp. GD03975 TaxID=2975412 RepID=UPI002449DC77|nr:DUF551 domain-containing protein [Enterobacter sp. GD03975]MDH1125145.1 DUF551 domain-containing protein [Enterobacter sp. GD03975]